jgi:hypothetical protein
MNRFKRLVRRFLIDKGILTWDEAARSTFFELIGMLTREVAREEDHINSQWTEGLRDTWQTALKHKEHWRAKAWQIIELLKQSGEDVIQALLPHIANEGSAFEGFRGPTQNDLPWMYWVLGKALEIVFGINDVLIPREAVKELSSHFGTFDRAINEEIWWSCSLEDCRTYWSFIEADLAAKGVTETPGSAENEQDEPEAKLPKQIAHNTPKTKADEKIQCLKEQFTLTEHQILFDNKDIEIPAGPCIKITSLLIEAMPLLVENKILNEASGEGQSAEAGDQLRSRIILINSQFKKHKVPCYAGSRRGAGYLMKSGKSPKQRRAKR